MAKGEGSRSDKAMAIIEKVIPVDTEESKKYRKKIEQYLRDSNVEELHPDGLKEDFDKKQIRSSA